jgi:hypothetical protein
LHVKLPAEFLEGLCNIKCSVPVSWRSFLQDKSTGGNEGRKRKGELETGKKDAKK